LVGVILLWMRILSLLRKNSYGFRPLARELRAPFATLGRHLDWLEERNLVESKMEKRKDGRTMRLIRLTKKGKKTAKLCSKILEAIA